MDIDILKIASDTKNHKKLDNCTHKSKHKKIHFVEMRWMFQ